MKTKVKISVAVLCLTAILAAGFLIRHEGQDVEKFYADAREGDAAKQTTLGLYYYRGDPFPQDYAKAMKWWKRAADQGYAEAQFNVGHMYWSGEGVSKDAVQAYLWITLAAARGNQEARESLPKLESKMSPDQIAEAKRRAAEWKPTPETKPETALK